MELNGINNVGNTQAAQPVEGKKSEPKEAVKTELSGSEKINSKEAVIFEKNSKTNQRVDNKAIVAKLKADAEERTAQLRSIVEKLMMGQSEAYGKANDIWSFLREGKFTVDPATKAQAQADIAEDGYWGVEATSDRIVDFAKALANNDPKKAEAMREAFKKGFETAEKTWGGELPEISGRTYQAVMEKFDKWENE